MMFKNLFAIIGFICIVASLVLFVKITIILNDFDSEAPRVYKELVLELLKTKNAAAATVWKMKVAEDVSAEDVEESMKLVANELNISNVGELPLSQDVSSKSNKDYRFVKIFMFCNSLTASRMMDYNDAFSAYLPCRITLLEDKKGQLWLYALNMDLMIYGGAPLPPALKEEALGVKKIILEMMRRGAEGDF